MQTMSSAAARRRAGFDELYRQIAALPPGVTGQILEAGVLTTMSRPGVVHEWALGGVEESLRDSSMRRSGHDWWKALSPSTARDDRLLMLLSSGSTSQTHRTRGLRCRLSSRPSRWGRGG
jgi:hypothetical protein